MRIQAFAIGLALAWAAIGGARATDVQFTITGGDRTATFKLPLSPTPNGFVLPGFAFDIASVSAVVGGSPVTLANLDFFSTEFGSGGFVGDGLFNFLGPQFYIGPEESPTFMPGVYRALRNVVTGKTDTVTVAELATIPNPPHSPDPPAVPELSTWAMLLLGFVGLSYAGYRKAKTSATLAA